MTCLFVNQLTVIDASFLDATYGVVGESWIVDVTLTGDLNDQGMIFDFGHVKKQIKKLIDQEFDHKLLAPTATTDIIKTKDATLLRFSCDLGTIEYRGPDSGIKAIKGDQVTIPVMENAITEAIKLTLPSNVKGCQITLRHEHIDGAWYRYSHGLKKHDGACQRIAHGHRSRIEILVDNLRSPELESKWAKTFAKYIHRDQ